MTPGEPPRRGWLRRLAGFVVLGLTGIGIGIGIGIGDVRLPPDPVDPDADDGTGLDEVGFEPAQLDAWLERLQWEDRYD